MRTGSFFPKRVSGPTTQNAAMTVDDQEGANKKETHPGHLQGAMRGIHARYRGQEEKTPPNGRLVLELGAVPHELLLLILQALKPRNFGERAVGTVSRFLFLFLLFLPSSCRCSSRSLFLFCFGGSRVGGLLTQPSPTT